MSSKSKIEIARVNRYSLLALHERSLAEHGGLRGLRDEGLLEFALARPQHILNDNNDASLAEVAAASSVGIARNHPFNDGNKRAALLVIGLFLGMHGYRLAVSQQNAALAMLAAASGDMREEELAAWISANLERRDLWFLLHHHSRKKLMIHKSKATMQNSGIMMSCCRCFAAALRHSSHR